MKFSLRCSIFYIIDDWLNSFQKITAQHIFELWSTNHGSQFLCFIWEWKYFWIEDETFWLAYQTLDLWNKILNFICSFSQIKCVSCNWFVSFHVIHQFIFKLCPQMYLPSFCYVLQASLKDRFDDVKKKDLVAIILYNTHLKMKILIISKYLYAYC